MMMLLKTKKKLIKELKELRQENISLKASFDNDNAERRQVEEILKENELKFRTLADYTFGWEYWESEDQKIIYMSPSCQRVTGYTRSEFISNPELLKKIVHPDDLDLFINHSHEVVLAGLPILPEDFDFKVISKDGTTVNINHICNPVFDVNGKYCGRRVSNRDITERMKTEEALRESEERFRHSFDYAASGICLVGINGKFQRINNAFKEMTGYDEGELKKFTFSDITYADDLSIGLTQLRKMLDGAIDNGSFEKRYIRKDKRIIWTYVSTSLIRDVNRKPQFFITQIIDISARKRAEKEIAMLAHSLKSVNECVSITDQDNKILFVNESFLKIYGYDINELIGKQINIVRSQNNVQKVVKAILPATIGGEWQGELLNKKKDGSEFPIFLSTSIIKDQNGKPLGLIGVATDITERKRAEKELIEAKEHAEESDRLKSAFLANMSHEIRTPMNGILGFAALLKEPNLTGEEQNEFISIIEKSGTRMLNIINDIISISKVESGQMEINLSDTNLNEQIEYIYTFFKPEVLKNGIQLIHKTSLTGEEAVIKTDREKVYAILTNLVKNAIKFTKKGAIEFGYEKKDNYLEFFVKDTGSGVRNEQKEFIFERFRQGSESLTRNYEGAGLGLSISKAYVEMLGGNIWVESEFLKGSAFYFTLPYNNEPEEKIVGKKTAL